jgi:hypothetical protein
MPITSIGSYLTTANAIDAHWTDVNADRVANTLTPLVLPVLYSLADFQDDRDALQATLIAHEDLENAMQLAIGDRDAQKENVRERLRQFRAAGKLYFAGSSYLQATPTMPLMNTNESRFLRPLNDMASLWTRLNAETGIAGFTPPLLLAGGYSAAGFAADLTTLRANYMAVTNADSDLDIARKQRDVQLGSIRERIQKYRTAIEFEYGPGHPFTESLPDLSPAPGSTPDAVTLSGSWNPTSNVAQLSWTASDDPALQTYQLRGCNGPTYNEAESSLIANFLPTTLATPTLFGLEFPGDQATFKVFVILSTGNQAGSNAVTMTRV